MSTVTPKEYKEQIKPILKDLTLSILKNRPEKDNIASNY